MTESADYHALPEQGVGGAHGGERVSRRGSQASAGPGKASRAPTPPHSSSTDEAALELAGLEDEMGPARPRGAPRPLPKAFLGSGYGRNSYFAWRLRVSSSLVALLAVVGIVTFWATDDIAYGGVNVNDVGYALAFHRTKTTACVDGTSYCGACDTIVTYAMLVYHVSPLLVIIGLPASGLRVFEPFRRQQGGGRQKQQRSVFFQICELISVLVLVFSLLVILYFVYAIFQGNNFHCSRAGAITYVLFAVLTFLVYFVVLTYFARFREHLKMQLGAFKETDQTGGIRSRLQRRHKYQSERSRVISDLRKHLYKETSLGNVTKMETLLEYAKERLGTDFAEEMYCDAKLVFKLFGRSNKNPLHVAAYLGNVQALQLLLDAGFRVDSYDKVSRVRFTTGDLFWTFAQLFVAKPVASEDEMAASIFRTTLVTPLHCAVSTGQIKVVQWLLEHGADVNLKSKASYWSDRMPPLFVADNPDIVALLLEGGANHLEVPDPGHMNTLTVLQMAYLRGNFPVAHELEEWGADVALTPLHEAAAKDNTTTIRKLLKTGADPNCVGEYGYTVSTEGVPVTEEMQVYIYTRQMVPFEPAIKGVNDSNKRKITYEYDENRFSAQFRLLLDGVRDEIEKQREANTILGSHRRMANGTSVAGFGENIADWDSASLENIEFAFVSHGDHHHSFVKRLHDRLQDSHIRCFLDGTQTYVDMTERIHVAKEAILKCSVFIVILSRKTVNSELVKDQLAFAEDKGQTILPIMLNDMEIPLDKHYTLSRLELLHFTPELGFNSSYQQLLGRVRDTMTGANASFNAPRASTRPTFRAVARMTAMSQARPNNSMAVNAAARAFLGRPRLSEAAVSLV
ncbi:Ankyrin repeat and EF-hand domain-containing protein 1 [Phytophthora boehmeriae]|uniref:Ankyrin repeat and EF-hand domain-containing protein 1 n=1 Tax=Phytophthora boehmeriae TaxID=109152 RepID=A0A8T1VJ02_9STRA|nr:Ankyrin repeat and EF-hand domain-containing protein 1 [Phytophthora boehmeriae]